MKRCTRGNVTEFARWSAFVKGIEGDEEWAGGFSGDVLCEGVVEKRMSLKERQRQRHFSWS